MVTTLPSGLDVIMMNGGVQKPGMEPGPLWHEERVPECHPMAIRGRTRRTITTITTIPTLISTIITTTITTIITIITTTIIMVKVESLESSGHKALQPNRANEQMESFIVTAWKKKDVQHFS